MRKARALQRKVINLKRVPVIRNPLSLRSPAALIHQLVSPTILPLIRLIASKADLEEAKSVKSVKSSSKLPAAEQPPTVSGEGTIPPTVASDA